MLRLSLAVAAALAVAVAAFDDVFLPGSEPYHKTGSAVGTAWAASVNDPTNAYLTYGPYWSGASGDMFVTWTLLIDNNSADDMHILTLDVTTDGGNTVLASMTVTRTQFNAPNVAQRFTLGVPAVAAGTAAMEFRVFYVCCAYVEHVQTEVTGPLTSGVFESFWSNSSRFEYVNRHQFPSPNGSTGASVGVRWWCCCSV